MLRIGMIALRIVIGGLLLLTAACGTSEGTRCNPLRFSDECAKGLACTTPKNCVVSICCPPPEQITKDSPGGCQACPAPDGGTN